MKVLNPFVTSVGSVALAASVTVAACSSGGAVSDSCRLSVDVHRVDVPAPEVSADNLGQLGDAAFRATVTNADGDPEAGVPVTFEVEGIHSAVAAATTNGRGIAEARLRDLNPSHARAVRAAPTYTAHVDFEICSDVRSAPASMTYTANS